MAKTKQEHLESLVPVVLKIQEKYEHFNQKHEERQALKKRIIVLGKQGLYDTDEFKSLKRKLDSTKAQVFNIGDELRDLQVIAKRLKKYKW